MNYLDLPVYKHKELILSALERNQAIVVESPTGSGKTTQLPVILHEAGYAAYQIIGVTQPRRIAALSVSEFIAKQMDSLSKNSSGIVAYKMRFEDKTSPATKIKIMTDGILLQEMKLDPLLSRYSCIIVDEAHERSLNIDFILGLLKRILAERAEFKVIVSSATINAQVFSEYFGGCPIVKIDAETFPVTIVYEPIDNAVKPPSKNDFSSRGARNAVQNKMQSVDPERIIAKIAAIMERITDERRKGDVLIFLSGEKIIKDCIDRLRNAPFSSKLWLIPLYGRLGKEEQERVFELAPRNKIKVVVSTNIAETSVTIDGVTSVIDSGFSKLNFYNPNTYSSSLLEGAISKASANQRKGRAGRTQEGVCYRLYTPKEFEKRPLFSIEEIYRTDLSEVLLRMADIGITEFEEFDFIAPPAQEGIAAAIETLNLLNALESDRNVSKIGKMMTEFPLAPRQSRIIVEAALQYPHVMEETIIAAAFLSTQSPYILPAGEEFEARQAHHRWRDPHGDFVSYLKLYEGYINAPNKTHFCDKNYLDLRTIAEIANIVVQLEEIVSGLGVPLLKGGSVEDYLCCIARGMIQFVCVLSERDSETYRSLTEEGILIHPGSVLFKTQPKYIVAGEVVRTSRMYAMSVSPLSPQVLDKISSELLSALGGKPSHKAKKRQNSSKKEAIGQNFEHSITIGKTEFAIKTIKKRQIVMIPFEKLGEIRNSDLNVKNYKRLRGRILLEDGVVVSADEKLDRILSLIPSFGSEKDLVAEALQRTCPFERYNLAKNPRDLTNMLAYFSLLGGLCPLDKHTRKNFGFISLYSDHGGNYWFIVQKSFFVCVTKSLAALEDLFDELDESVDLELKSVINETFRRLSNATQNQRLSP